MAGRHDVHRVDIRHKWRTAAGVDRTTIYLTPEQRRRLRDAARRTGRRQADLIRAALDAYLAEVPATRPRSIGVGEDAGLDASASEAWLRERWGAGPGGPPKRVGQRGSRLS